MIIAWMRRHLRRCAARHEAAVLISVFGEPGIAIVHRRWDSLLARRRALRLRALLSSPLRSRRRRSAASSSQDARVHAIAAEPHPSTNGRGADASRASADAVSRKQIRGAGLLLSGRGLALGFKLLATRGTAAAIRASAAARSTARNASG